MNVNNVLIQGVGYLALFFVILSFQKNKRRLILLYLAIAQVFFAIHFALLNAWTGVALDSIAAFRTFIFYKKETKSWAKKHYLVLLISNFIWTIWIVCMGRISQLITSFGYDYRYCCLMERGYKINKVYYAYSKTYVVCLQLYCWFTSRHGYRDYGFIISNYWNY